LIIAGFGDSITRGVFVEEHSYLNVLAAMTGASVINAGIPGQTSTQAIGRLDSDVLGRSPDLCIVAFGMNDHVCKAPDTPKTPLAQFKENLRTICSRLKAKGITAVLCTVHPIIEGNSTAYYYARHPKEWYRNPPGAQARIEMYNEAIREAARLEGAALADVAAHWSKAIAGGCRLEDLLLTAENFGKDDGVHPNAKGHRLYAECIAEKIADL